MQADRPETEPQDWREERLCYRVLAAVHQRAGPDCTRGISATELDLPPRISLADLVRTLDRLAERGYLFRLDGSLRVCITPKGIRYIEKAAGRRRSVRLCASAGATPH